MSDEWPKIVSRSILKISPWMNVIARDVEFSPGAKPETYHAVGQQDYLAILAITPDGYIPLIRQYRPAIESFLLELPAGLVEAGEDPASASSRELLEETGYPTSSIHWLGSNHPCAGRLSNRIHSYFIETGEQHRGFVEEPGVKVVMVSPTEFSELIRTNQFTQQMHLGTLFQAYMQGFLSL